ncbi:MAG: hypothetical protein RL199_326 [Pseudomonadota bacterium]|jgi:hypothetical protein
MRALVAAGMVALAAGCGRSVVVRPASTSFAPSPSVVPAGTLVGAQLRHGLSTAESHVGDLFQLELLEAVTDASGRERLARGTVVEGRVAFLRASTLAGRSATFALAIVGARIERSLVRVPLEIVVGEASLGRSWRRDLALGLLGAAAGAGVGLAVDRDSGPLVFGAALVGGAAGSLASAMFGRQEAALPAGGTVTLRTTRDWE